MTYYGQSKPPEDQIADAVFGDFVGTAIEVGAFDGVHLSNCYHFYLRDWQCINCEAHPENYAALCRNQPDAHNIFGAISATDQHMVSIATTPGKPIVTGFDLPEWYIKSEVPGGRSGLTAIEVPCYSLNTVLERCLVDDQTVDYVSIDTDGTEMDVLRGFDLNRWQPRLFIVEYNHALHEMAMYLQGYGYHLAHDNGLNAFFTMHWADYNAVRMAVR